MWQFDGKLATVELGDVRLAIALGIGDRKVQVKTPDDLLLATLWDMPQLSGGKLVDAYVRDDDLVCLVAPSESFPFHTQLYWTLRTAEVHPIPLVALSLLVCVLTDSLDAHPSVEVLTEAAHRDSSKIDASGSPAYLVPLRSNVTLVDFATPEDCARQEMLAPEGGRLTIRRNLFDHFLEKGVIRSGRLFAALYAGDIDTHQATTACQSLLAADLPLTT